MSYRRRSRPDRAFHLSAAGPRDGVALRLGVGGAANGSCASRGAISWGLVGGEAELAAGVAARRELEEWTSDRLDERRRGAAPDDLLQWLVEPDASGVLLDDDYIRTNVNFLAAAGSSTVDYALRNVLWALFAHPTSRPRSRGRRDSVDRACHGNPPLSPRPCRTRGGS